MYVSKKVKNSTGGFKMSKNGSWLGGGSLIMGLVFLSACASMQSPSGGPKDAEAPKVLKENPKNQSTKFSASEITLSFNEFIKLSNASAEVSISPALEKPLEFDANKETLTIKLNQALEPNTTYTISFGKAIGDVNENNVLKNYAYVFSTGTGIDSLSISGNVKNALENENVKEALVFLFPSSQDSLLGKKKPNTYTYTNDQGNFTFQNLKAGSYKVYAIKEQGSDRIYNQGLDEIGYLSESVDLKKSIVNLKFLLFKEVPKEFKIKDKKIESDGRILIVFNKAISNPSIKELSGFNQLKNSVIEFSPSKDSAMVWLPELGFDSLKLGIYTDDVLLNKVDINRNKRESYIRNPILRDNVVAAKLKPGADYTLYTSMPSTLVDSTKWSLWSDSIKLKNYTFKKIDPNGRKFTLSYPFKSGKSYTIKVEEGAFKGSSGMPNKPYTKTFIQDDYASYGTMNVLISVSDSSKTYIVQLVNDQKVVLREDIISGNSLLNYKTYPIGKYRIRVVLDENKNKAWDTGSIELGIQPEKIWKYSKEISLRANWEIEEKITLPAEF